MGVWSGHSERFQPWPSFPKPAAAGMFRRGPSSRPQDQAPQGDRPLMNTAALDLWAPRVLSILRIVAALIFFEHGTQKLLGFPPAANAPAFLSLSWTRRPPGARRRRPPHPGPLDPPGRLHPLRRDGLRLLHRPCAAELLPGAERGRRGDPLLLRVPLLRVLWAGPMERRRDADEGNLTSLTRGPGKDLPPSDADEPPLRRCRMRRSMREP